MDSPRGLTPHYCGRDANSHVIKRGRGVGSKMEGLREVFKVGRWERGRCRQEGRGFGSK